MLILETKYGHGGIGDDVGVGVKIVFWHGYNLSNPGLGCKLKVVNPPIHIILFDEFQNVTDNNGKTLLTRFSENTKVIALGDSNQVDLKNPETSCLSELVRMAKLIPEEGVNVVEFTEAEVVRHRLTKYFIQIFEHKDYKKKSEFKPILNKKEKYKSFFQKFLSLFR